MVLIVGAVIVNSLVKTNKNENCDTINEVDQKEDCYHTFAHKTNNISYCNKIRDGEKKEHCLGHVPS